MLVREARVADAPQIARVHVDSWRTTYAGIVSEDFLAGMSYEDFEARWHGWLEVEESVVYVAESPSAQIVGFAFGGPQREEDYSAYEGELYAAYLLREHQRKGLGRQLLGAVAKGLARQGKTSMLAWVLADNRSRHFYEVVGGKPLGIQEIEIGGVMLQEVAYGWEDLRALIPFVR
jgi:GNAT superfamily N-acetyltransferase